MGTNINKPTHLSFVDNLETQAECNSVSRRAVNAKKMISVRCFQMPFYRQMGVWSLGPGFLHSFSAAGLNQLFCCICVQFSDAHFTHSCHFNGVFFSPCLCVSIYVCAFCFFIHPLFLSFPLSLIMCSCGVFLSFPGR